MNVQTISTKQLRENFHLVLGAVRHGRSLRLTYRNQYVADIKPARKKTGKPDKEEIERRLRKVRKLAGGFRFGIEWTADEMNKAYDEDVYGEVLPRR